MGNRQLALQIGSTKTDRCSEYLMYKILAPLQTNFKHRAFISQRLSKMASMFFTSKFQLRPLSILSIMKWEAPGISHRLLKLMITIVSPKFSAAGGLKGRVEVIVSAQWVLRIYKTGKRLLIRRKMIHTGTLLLFGLQRLREKMGKLLRWVVGGFTTSITRITPGS